MIIRNNYVFKGHRTLLGNRYVTYGEVSLDLHYDLFSKSRDGFDWGNATPASMQLAFSILNQLSNINFAKEHALEFCNDVIKFLNSRNWLLNAADVVKWIEENKQSESAQELKPELIIDKPKIMRILKPPQKAKKDGANLIKDVCQKLSITQKDLAEILEIQERTVYSWTIKNEVPILARKAIEFYMQNKKSQDVVDSCKSFVRHLKSA